MQQESEQGVQQESEQGVQQGSEQELQQGSEQELQQRSQPGSDDLSGDQTGGRVDAADRNVLDEVLDSFAAKAAGAGRNSEGVATAGTEAGSLPAAQGIDPAVGGSCGSTIVGRSALLSKQLSLNSAAAAAAVRDSKGDASLETAGGAAAAPHPSSAAHSARAAGAVDAAGAESAAAAACEAPRPPELFKDKVSELLQGESTGCHRLQTPAHDCNQLWEHYWCN